MRCNEDGLIGCGTCPESVRDHQRFAEPALAVFAVTDAVASESGPAVVSQAFRLRAFNDFGQDSGEVFIVVGAVYTRDVLVGGAIRLSRCINREPIRVGAVELLRRPIGVIRARTTSPSS